MGRKVAIPWHMLFSVGAGVLYFLCVLPRWSELMGDTPRALGIAGRIGAGALIALAALPVVFTHLRTRKPELGTPQLALTLRLWSIVAHVLAGVLIIGTTISELWLSLDAAGKYLFGIYGAAAAIGLLGIFAFYLSFVAELPPPPPKPIKPKKAKRRRLRGKKGAEAEDTEEAPKTEAEAEEAETVTAEESVEPTAKAVEAVKAEKPATEDTPETHDAKDDAKDTAKDTENTEVTESADEGEEPRSGLRNRRPTGKGSHRMRRRRTRGGVALDE
ncbi:hypothetical protein [Mycobacterium sherrisii]|uniref:Transmembrane protein n=1 Tax=Mycobacterium sherrisii TaxID=243061 RepID=A0A1E3SYT1_9MYCO|nr:hypothetical protein [Mycobacterium sherrisii]MCV7031100.1 hypothetical protein [Mycobacterium sherrisii]MEC4761717.1 hypothetical protein [Mycobacterium sherrisii]ODR07220.1 hypothetical protein BHQ21_09120 [Mycobacterium sherrisii]ORW73568.1 hypothetical protein AWC25_17585 [Mycobacterium sherrisii]